MNTLSFRLYRGTTKSLLGLLLLWLCYAPCTHAAEEGKKEEAVPMATDFPLINIPLMEAMQVAYPATMRGAYNVSPELQKALRRVQSKRCCRS